MLLKIFLITPLDKTVFTEAIANNGQDFEDSVIYSTALNSNIDYTITRDKKDFKSSKVKTIEPSSFLAFYNEIYNNK